MFDAPALHPQERCASQHTRIREQQTVHTADDGYCIAECSHGFGSDVCGLEVVRPGKFQCWCDHSCDGTGYYHDEGICEDDHRLAVLIAARDAIGASGDDESTRDE